MKSSKDDSSSPDAVTYGNLLKCVANLMEPGSRRSEMASNLFFAACQDGLVGGMCLDEIRRCVPPRVFLPLLADCGYDTPMVEGRKPHSVQLKELPKKWLSNVKKGDLVARQRASFKPKPSASNKRRKTSSRRREEKRARPAIRRPGSVTEYGSSSKEL